MHILFFVECIGV